MKRTYINKPNFQKLKQFDLKNFWYYYKFHTIFALFAVFLVFTLVWEVTHQTKPDLLINYVGSPSVSEQAQHQLRDALVPVITDVNGDKKVQVDFVPMLMHKFKLVPESQDSVVLDTAWEQDPDDQDILMLQKVSLEMTAGEPSLFLADEGVVQLYMTQGVFEPLDGYASQGHPVLSGTTQIDEEGEPAHVYGISVENNRLLNELGIPTEGKFLAVKRLTEGQKGKAKPIGMHQMALEGLSYLLSYND